MIEARCTQNVFDDRFGVFLAGARLGDIEHIEAGVVSFGCPVRPAHDNGSDGDGSLDSEAGLG